MPKLGTPIDDHLKFNISLILSAKIMKQIALNSNL
jgi:hypothetical protein